MSAFISYLRADLEKVESLRRALKAKGADTWFDLASIEPGQQWAEAINTAIEKASYFLACFSLSTENEEAFRKTYMFEELLIAARTSQQKPDRWLIPVMLDECAMPNVEIRDGRTIRDYQWVMVAGDKWDDGINRLAEIVAQLKKLDAQNRLREVARRVREAAIPLAHAEARIEFEHHESVQEIIARKTPPQHKYDTVRKEYEVGCTRYVQTFDEEFHPLGELQEEMADDKARIFEKHRLDAAQGRRFATTLQWLIILGVIVMAVGIIATQELFR